MITTKNGYNLKVVEGLDLVTIDLIKEIRQLEIDIYFNEVDFYYWTFTELTTNFIIDFKPFDTLEDNIEIIINKK